MAGMLLLHDGAYYDALLTRYPFQRVLRTTALGLSTTSGPHAGRSKWRLAHYGLNPSNNFLLLMESSSTCRYSSPLYYRGFIVASVEKHRPLSSSETIESAPQVLVYITLVMNDDDEKLLGRHRGTGASGKNLYVAWTMGLSNTNYKFSVKSTDRTMALRKLTPELEELAKKECNEEPARLQQDLQHIRDWLAKQPHLKSRTGKSSLLN
ncbi:hypothetical protein ANN_04950 [Periplaneta americana]|uniref:Uncharacterized protein n=1 Tax=Periplaneta americana TaxID=6978 RepID=A0ABQ8TBV3_PERAM|nr:hypothetical protein ANN_04950 [Periplaneta americana]